MNKIVKFILIFVSLPIGIWIVGRLTNTLQFYAIPSLANYPNIKVGDHVFASNLIRPHRLDFICYYSDSTAAGKQIFAHRLCGIEGDKIEIVDGNLFVNNNNVDLHLNLTHKYIFASNELEKIEQFEEIDETYVMHSSNDTIIADVSDKTIKANAIGARRITLPRYFKDEQIARKYNSNWNQDNFGPVIVPKGTYFVMGDNRMNSLDSRYTGFIPQSRFIGTIIGRK